MLVTNHLLAGSIIALSIHEPALVIVLAYSSHFLMDATPHFGYPGGHNFSQAVKIASKYKLAYVFSAFTLVSSILITILLISANRWFALLAGLIAISPDAIMFFNYLLYERKGMPPRGPEAYKFLNFKFHGKIQNESPSGIYIEIVVFALFFALLLKLI